MNALYIDAICFNIWLATWVITKDDKCLTVVIFFAILFLIQIFL